MVTQVQNFQVSVVTTDAQREMFLDVPFKVYKNYPNWVPPIRSSIAKQLAVNENPFLEYGEFQQFIAISQKNRQPLGRIVAVINRRLIESEGKNVGLFGYFPTYSLGNIYAAQLNLALRDEVPDLDDRIASGDTSAVLSFLRERVHAKGSLLEPADLMEQASGHAVSSEPLLDYLEEKYAAIYGLNL